MFDFGIVSICSGMADPYTLRPRWRVVFHNGDTLYIPCEPGTYGDWR